MILTLGKINWTMSRTHCSGAVRGSRAGSRLSCSEHTGSSCAHRSWRHWWGTETTKWKKKKSLPLENHPAALIRMVRGSAENRDAKQMLQTWGWKIKLTVMSPTCITKRFRQTWLAGGVSVGIRRKSNTHWLIWQSFLLVVSNYTPIINWPDIWFIEQGKKITEPVGSLDCFFFKAQTSSGDIRLAHIK